MMTKELVERLANLSLLGYYDESLKLLCVHFFEEGDKQDLMAYLRADLSWELREVVSESAVLYDDRELVTIIHSALGSFEAGSKFDQFVREMLAKQLTSEGLIKDDIMEGILKNGYQD
jgi:hypothetical protein